MGLLSFIARRIQTKASAPATANEGDVYYNTATHAFNVATAANTWTAIASSSGTAAGGSNTQVQYNNSGALGGISGLTTNGSTTLTQTSNSATAFESGPAGGTNPVLRLVNNVASQATGLSITGNATGNGVTLTALDSGSNSNITLVPKGSGIVAGPGATSLVAAAFGFAGVGSGAGLSYAGSGGWALVDNATASLTSISGDVYLRPGGSLSWSSSGSAGSTAADTTLNRVSAGVVGVGTAVGAGFAGSLKFTNAVMVGKATTYNNLATAGMGLTTILGVTSQKAETTTADANVLTVSPGATVGTFRLSVQISVSAATSGVIGWTATWTDSNGNAQTPTNLSLFQSGTAAPALTFTTSVAGNYYGEAIIDVNNANANIVIKWTGGGTTTAKMSAIVERLQ